MCGGVYVCLLIKAAYNAIKFDIRIAEYSLRGPLFVYLGIVL